MQILSEKTIIKATHNGHIAEFAIYNDDIDTKFYASMIDYSTIGIGKTKEEAIKDCWKKVQPFLFYEH